MVMDQRFKHKRSWAKTSGVKDLVRVFAAAVAISMVMMALILMIYWIQSILEFPKHLLIIILGLLKTL